VTGPEFSFSVQWSGDAVSRALLSELTARVLDRAGCSGQAAAEVSGALQTALEHAKRHGARPCGVRFTAASGRLDIVISGGGGSVWQTSRSIP
jgi:hypothetical protein